MIITLLNEKFRFINKDGVITEIKVYKLPEGFYTAEIFWVQNEVVMASETMSYHKTLSKLQKEFNECSEDLGFQVTLKIKEDK